MQDASNPKKKLRFNELLDIWYGNSALEPLSEIKVKIGSREYSLDCEDFDINNQTESGKPKLILKTK